MNIAIYTESAPMARTPPTKCWSCASGPNPSATSLLRSFRTWPAEGAGGSNLMTSIPNLAIAAAASWALLLAGILLPWDVPHSPAHIPQAPSQLV